jgi:hypothetical protein
MAELEKELGLALEEEQVKLLFAGIPTSSPLLVKAASSPYPLSKVQYKVLLRHLATPISDKYRYILRASRSSAPADPALGGKPIILKQEHQDIYIEISSDIYYTHYSVNTDDSYNACNTSDEDLRPAKRRKPRSVHAVTPPLHLRRSPPLLPTTRAEIDEA